MPGSDIHAPFMLARGGRGVLGCTSPPTSRFPLALEIFIGPQEIRPQDVIPSLCSIHIQTVSLLINLFPVQTINAVVFNARCMISNFDNQSYLCNCIDRKLKTAIQHIGEKDNVIQNLSVFWHLWWNSSVCWTPLVGLFCQSAATCTADKVDWPGKRPGH